MSDFTIPTTFESFKKLAADFFKMLPDCDREQADAGFKCLALGWLGMIEGSDLEFHQAEIILELAIRKMDERITELRAGGTVDSVGG